MSQTVKGHRSRVASYDKDSECCISCQEECYGARVAKHWEPRVCSKITDNDYKLLNTIVIYVSILFFCTFCCSSNFDNGD